MTNDFAGRMVGRYRILDFLGAGAMGEVFVAEDPQIERRLAIKTVRLAGRPQEIEDRKRRLLREARAAGRLLHPNVVTLFDAGEAEGMLYLAFELVEGTDLAGRLEAGPPLSLREVLRIIRQVADALDFAHRQGIVHRDIKPSNILLDKQGKVKVADFGIAKVTGQSTELTVAGSVMGSPQYLSPEQIRGEELDGRSDVFSLGVVLYELLSQKRPFDGDTITTLVYQILHKEPPPISELRAVPERLEALLRRMLAKSRDERFATAGELAAEVAACERELSDETLSAPAANLPMQATRILPKRTTDAVQSPDAPGIPGTPPTGTYVPGGAAAAAPPLPPRVPTPPPIPARAVATPPAGAVAPGPPAAASRPGYGKGLAVAILLVVFLMIGGGAAGVWWFFFRHPASTVEGNGVGIPPGQDTPIPSSSPPSTGPIDSAPPAISPAATTAAPPAPDRKEPEPALSSAQVSRPIAGPSSTAPPSRPSQPFQTPQPSQTPPTPGAPSQRGPYVPPAPEAQRPAPVPVPESPSRRSEPEEDERPARRSDSGSVDETLNTGLALVFRPTPPNAYVLVDGTMIGPATEWNGQKGGRTFILSGPGEHLIKLRSEGMKEHKIRIEATETGGVTPILTRLKPLPAAQADASDLKVYRVREAIGFRVEPPGATILVDGQPAGQVKNFGGRLMQPGSWLKLPPGRHRIGLTASGMGRQDFIVEVYEGAEKDRDRIEATLQPGG